MAVVHSCYPTFDEESVLTKRWRSKYIEDCDNGKSNETPYDPTESNLGKTPMYHLIPVIDTSGHTLMIPYHSQSKYLFQVIDHSLWGDKFNEN